MLEMVYGSVAAPRGRALACVHAAAVALTLALPLVVAPRSALAAPEAAKVRTAAEEFDEAVRLYKQKDYAAAANHFEAADAAVASPKAVRLAIRSRAEAGQAARAATLSAYALDKYPADQETAAVAKETLEKLKPSLQEVKVSCATLCILAVAAQGESPRSVHGSANTRWTLYVGSGSSTVSASFLGNLPGSEKPVDGIAGRSMELRFDPGSGATPAPVPPPPADAPPVDAPPESKPPPAEEDGGGLSPFFFLAGAVLTAGAGGVTVWSGIDTTNSPGEDAVRAGCAGQGTECALYQDGLAKEMRTNVFIGVTAGLAATTLVLAILTDWDGDPEASVGGTGPRKRVGAVELAAPAIAAGPREGALSLSGRF